VLPAETPQCTVQRVDLLPPADELPAIDELPAPEEP
jgi:hypothetical protein